MREGEKLKLSVTHDIGNIHSQFGKMHFNKNHLLKSIAPFLHYFSRLESSYDPQGFPEVWISRFITKQRSKEAPACLKSAVETSVWVDHSGVKIRSEWGQAGDNTKNDVLCFAHGVCRLVTASPKNDINARHKLVCCRFWENIVGSQCRPVRQSRFGSI